MENNENIKEAKDELDKISQDDILRRMALKAELERMDQEQLLYEAKRDGKLEGKLERKRRTENQSGKLEVAKKMLEEKIEIDTIIKVTGLSKEEIMSIY